MVLAVNAAMIDSGSGPRTDFAVCTAWDHRHHPYIRPQEGGAYRFVANQNSSERLWWASLPEQRPRGTQEVVESVTARGYRFRSGKRAASPCG